MVAEGHDGSGRIFELLLAELSPDVFLHEYCDLQQSTLHFFIRSSSGQLEPEKNYEIELLTYY